MAIQINGTTVIDNNKNIVNVENGNYVGIVTASKFRGVNTNNLGVSMIVFS